MSGAGGLAGEALLLRRLRRLRRLRPPVSGSWRSRRSRSPRSRSRHVLSAAAHVEEGLKVVVVVWHLSVVTGDVRKDEGLVELDAHVQVLVVPAQLGPRLEGGGHIVLRRLVVPRDVHERRGPLDVGRIPCRFVEPTVELDGLRGVELDGHVVRSGGVQELPSRRRGGHSSSVCLAGRNKQCTAARARQSSPVALRFAVC